ncbi:complement C1q tumor necrosis factor-related protein 4-like isoform X2 [Protopterus annectens]|nr:complement C1q tumor necrosis factor-related protein 4-like isoform X2 [Protopterus annectens]XP_043911210.1 complement C1q tumor necrosis factor-related protein 4-like isoform X2 [Protopterus annectens]XP_043911211.1 complement C1q tumor necrosis factor-related protein 4-like isoform X2 [Protopterus annectens]
MLLLILATLVTAPVTTQAAPEDEITNLKSRLSQVENELGVIKQLQVSIQNFQALGTSRSNANNNKQQLSGSTCPSDVQHVYFFACYTKTVVGAMDPIRYDNVFVNVGDSYKAATGIFTCPTSGVYQFFFGINFGRGSMTNVWLVQDGKRIIINHSDLPGLTSLNQQVLLLKAKKGSQIWVIQEKGNSWSAPEYPAITFGGVLLHATDDI